MSMKPVAGERVVYRPRRERVDLRRRREGGPGFALRLREEF
jgi:hypothetical protein